MDIATLTPGATSTPDQAASNIQNASIFSLNPTSNQDFNKQLAPQVQDLLKPTEASPAVKDFMSQSTEHTALAIAADPKVPTKSDLPQHNFIDDTAKYMGDIIYNRPTDDQKIIDLSNKKLSDPTNFSDEDNLALWQLNQDRKTSQAQSYKEPPSYPSQVGNAILETGRGLRRNAPLIAAFTGGEALVGGGLGLMAGGVGAVPGAIAGATAGLGHGLTVAFMKDAYDTATGGTYNELSNMTNPDGSPVKVDDGTKAALSRGVGVISAALMGVVGHTIAKASPFLSKFVSPKLATDLILNPTNAAILKTVVNIGAATGAGGLAGGGMEASRIFAEEMAKNYDGTEAGFMNVLKSVSDHMDQYAPRVGQAMAVGAGTAATLSTVAGVTGFGKTKAAFEARSEEAIRGVNERLQNTRDVTPGAPEQLQGARDVTPANPDQGPSVGPVAPENSIQQSVKVLQLQDAMTEMATVANSTKMQQLAPEQMTSMMQRVFQRAGISKLYTTAAALRQFANDPEKGKAARNLIDPSGVAASQMNAPFEVDPAKVMEVAQKHPEILDQMQVDPNGPNSLQAKEHLKNLQGAADQRTQILTKLGIPPEDVQPEAKSNVVQMPEKAPVAPFDLESNVKRASDIIDELATPVTDKQKTKLNTELEGIKTDVAKHFKMQDPGDLLVGHWPEPGEDQSRAVASNYVNAPTFTEAIQNALPKADVQKFNIAQQNARKSVADNIKDTAVHEMTKVQDIQVEEAHEIRLQTERDRIANDPNYAVVDRIREAGKAAKAGKATSVYAIDPKTLTDDQLKYLDHFRLKEHGIFKKGGADADSVASLLGVPSGNELLQILAKTPTREQVAKARAKANVVADEQEARNSVDLNHTRIIEALRETTANHIAEMKFMREQEWPATKLGIKKIALPLPRIEELTQRAKDMVKQTKVGSLTAEPFKVGERRSTRTAVNAILKNEVEKAFVAKENAALNSEMVKETYIAIAQVNRALRFARKFNDKGTMQILRDAGPLYLNAANEILSVFNLNPSKKGQSELGSYQKWLKQELARGRGDFSIPERLSDIRQHVNDMTVEQLYVVTDRLKIVLHEAKVKSQMVKLKGDLEEAQAERDVERISDKIDSLAKEFPGFNSKRLPPTQGNRHGWDNMKFRFAQLEALISAKQYIYRELDQGKVGGYFQETFDHQMEGSGKYFEKSGYTKQKKMLQELHKNIKKVIDVHGEVHKLERNFLNIPEFANIPELGNGQLTKGDLLTAWANRGQAYTKELLFKNNGGVTDEIWQKVFDRELEAKDTAMVQGIVNLYRNYRDEISELQKRQGRDVTFIEGIPNEHKGVVYPGGYIRARYVHDYTQADAKNAKDFLDQQNAAHFEKKNGAEWGRQWAAETTDQGYLVSRTGSKDPLNLSFRGLFDGLQEIIHDLSYREPLMNFFTLATHPDIAKNMIQMVGEPKFNLLIQTNLEIAGRPSANESGYFTDSNRFIKRVYNKFANNFAVTTLLGNSSVIVKQFEALTEQFNALGPKGVYHFTRANATMLANLDKMGGFINFAKQLDPNLSKYFDGVQDKAVSVVDDLIPRKSTSGKAAKYLDPLETARQMAVTAGFLPVSAADAYLKTLQALAVYRQVISGDHPDVSLEELHAMTQEEQFAKVQGIVQQMSSLTMIQNRKELQAPLQDNLFMKPFAPFWNYPRNVLNNTLNDVRRAKWKTQEGLQKLGVGGGGRGGGERPPVQTRYTDFNEGGADFKGAGKDFGTAAGVMLSRMVYATIALALTKYAQGKISDTVDDLKQADYSTIKGLYAAGTKMLGHLLMSPLELAMDTTPVINDMVYASEHKKKYGMAEVTTSVTQALSSIATCAGDLSNVITLSHGFSRMGIRACLQSESYSYIPIPVSAGYKAMRWLEDHHTSPAFAQAQFQTAQIDGLQKQLKEYVANPPEDANPKFVKQADVLQKQLAPQTVKVPPTAADTIKIAESGGDWSRPNGLYGFTQTDWKNISKSAPELGLTEAGRTAKDTSQQEKAIEWSLHENAGRLAEKDMPVNSSSLYGAHKLGVEDYEKLFNAPADAKVKTVLGDISKEHPELANFKTIGQVKSYFNGAAAKAEKAVQTDNNLTSKTSQNED